ncbi:hypothetical protein, partial [Salmonella sp. SAL4434]|uniref:hypothetical protein n=1 Tax=Salmonella sp. SAL4434 TaxID=3159889 RepID=UPI00397A1705
VTVAAGATSATFAVATQAVAATTDVTLTTSYDPDGAGPGGPASATTVQNVKRADLRGLSFSPSNVVVGGSTTALVITLTSP